MNFKIVSIYKDSNGNLWTILSHKNEGDSNFLEYWYTKDNYGLIEMSNAVEIKNKEVGLTQTIEVIENVKDEEKWN